jgi:hypothetical protein
MRSTTVTKTFQIWLRFFFTLISEKLNSADNRLDYDDISDACFYAEVRRVIVGWLWIISW